MRCFLISFLALAAPVAMAEPFIDVGVSATETELRIANVSGTSTTSDASLHLGLGASRRVGERNEFGVRLELDRVDSSTLLAVRALDLRRHVSEKLAYSVFLGAARLDLPTAAFGYYYGVGIQMKELLKSWDLSVDLRIGGEIARDNLLPSDPQGGSDDNFRDLAGLSVYLSKRF